MKLYAADIMALPDPKYARDLSELLSSARKEKTLKFLQADDRKRSFGAGLLLQKVLPCYGVQPEKIWTGVNGKPAAEGICFNLSHSGSLVICAVGERSVGCDVEKITKAPEQVAEHFFHSGEIKYLKNCRKGCFKEEFFRFWTMKESYVKMTGEGMALPFDRFEVVPGKDKVLVRREGELLSCRITEYHITEYKIAVCAQEPCSPDIIYLSKLL